jgi:hypothetical protein
MSEQNENLEAIVEVEDSVEDDLGDAAKPKGSDYIDPTTDI